MQAAKELQDRENYFSSLSDSSVVQAFREIQERDAEIRRLIDSPALRIDSPTLLGTGTAGSYWSQPRRSEELERLAEAAHRSKEKISRQIEAIDPSDKENAGEELETIRAIAARQERESRRAARLERHRERKAEADYWFRQWMNSLAIGNGAGFLAVTSGLLQAGRLERAITLVFAPLTYFALGLLFAGALRLLVWSTHTTKLGSLGEKVSQRATLAATTISALLFVCGITSSVFEVAQFNKVASQIASKTASIETKELLIRDMEADNRIRNLEEKLKKSPPKPLQSKPAQIKETPANK